MPKPSRSAEQIRKGYPKVWECFTELADACHDAGPLPATVRNKPYILTAEATADAEVCVISAKRFREMLSTDTLLAMTVVSMLAEEISILHRLAVHEI